MRRTAILIFLAFSLTSCVKEPGAIQAESVNPSIHAGKNCEQLAAERQRIDTEYATAEARQNQASSHKVANIIFFEASMLNALDQTNERKIARLKGERDAVARALAAGQCDNNR